MVEDDWQYIAIIIDRVLLIAYTFGKIKFESLQQGIYSGWLFSDRKSVFKNLELHYIFLYDVQFSLTDFSWSDGIICNISTCMV